MRSKRSARKLRGGSVAEHMYRELPVKIKGNIVYRAKLAAIFVVVFICACKGVFLSANPKTDF